MKNPIKKRIILKKVLMSNVMHEKNNKKWDVVSSIDQVSCIIREREKSKKEAKEN